MAVRPKGNSTYMVDFMVKGERVRVFGFTDKNEAQAWELSARAAIKRDQPLPSVGKATTNHGVTIREHFRQVAPLQWKGKKAEKGLSRTAELFVEWAGDNTTVSEALSQEKINEYVRYLQSTGVSGGTINRRLAGVSVLSKYAVHSNIVAARPLLPTQPSTGGRLRWFSREETDALFRTLEDWGLFDWRGFFICLLDLGARTSELRNLTWQDIDLTNGRVTFYETKNATARTLPLSERVKEFLRSRRNHRHPFSFATKTGVRQVWERLRGHYDWIGDAVPYTFRHTCASWLVHAGVDLMRVKEWMGHKTIQTTMIYAHLAPKHLQGMEAILSGTWPTVGEKIHD